MRGRRPDGLMTGTTHGESHSYRTTEYNSWTSMKMRCLQPSHDSYPRYGGRGITVCARWIGSFENFLADMGRKPTAEHSLDRINGKGNYEPDNCRWATKAEQAANTAFKYKKTDKPVLRSDGTAYRSIGEAAASVGVHKTLIWQACRKGRTAHGFRWEYVDDVYKL